MDVEFLGQPFADRPSGRDILAEWLDTSDQFWAFVAWGQVGGLEMLAESLRRFSARGGKSKIILGIDQGIATREALELAIDLFSEAFVFHDPTGRTFHPKVYCAETGSVCRVLLGSGNLTEGGLSNSYEAGLLLHLDRGRIGDAEVYDDILAYWKDLKGKDMPCRRLDAKLVKTLSKIPRLITSETQRQAAQRRTDHTPGRRGAIFKLFNPPKTGRLAARVQRSGGKSQSKEMPSDPAAPADVTTGPKNKPLVWYKKLTASDVIRKPEGSHNRNFVVLGQARHPIDRNTWFRNELFGSAGWQITGMKGQAKGNAKQKEVAEVNMHVVVGEKDLGVTSIRVEHAMHRLSNQKNAPTWLHWAGMLPVIKRRDFRGWYLSLERTDSGEMLLRLSPKIPK